MKKASPRWNFSIMVLTGVLIIALFQHHLASRATIINAEATRLNLGEPRLAFPFGRRAIEEWESKITAQYALEAEVKTIKMKAVDKGLSISDWQPPYSTDQIVQWRKQVAAAPVSPVLLKRLNQRVEQLGLNMTDLALPLDGHNAGLWAVALDNLEALPPPADQNLFVMRTEVTQGLYMVVMGENPATSTSCGVSCPVDFVSFSKAKAFAKRLNQAMGLGVCAKTITKKCMGWRLPTLEEWRLFASADGLEYPAEKKVKGWFLDNSEGELHPVASQPPNDFGLFDVFGNVSEWIDTPANGEHIGGSMQTLRAAQREVFMVQDGLSTQSVGFRLIRRQQGN